MEFFDDDFEFKPLTKGLGFHQKTIDLSSELKKSDVPNQQIIEKSIPKAPPSILSQRQNQIDSVNKIISAIPSYEESTPNILKPLPREKPATESLSPEAATTEIPRYQPLKPTFKSQISEDISFKDSLKTEIATPLAPIKSNKVSAEPLPIALREIPFSVSAFIFDLLVVAALSCLFTGVVLAITNSDFELVMANAQNDLPTRISLALLVISVIQLYVILSRSFFSKTIGEWAFDMQLGNIKQQNSAWYPLAVAWRAILITMTGFITLPILSMLIRKDITGRLCGLRLYRAQ